MMGEIKGMMLVLAITLGMMVLGSFIALEWPVF
jgi:hypothetical protein